MCSFDGSKLFSNASSFCFLISILDSLALHSFYLSYIAMYLIDKYKSYIFPVHGASVSCIHF